MAKSKKELALELENIPKYKWEFLRRNEDYWVDCERFARRKRNRWNDRWVIVGYEFSGDLSHFQTRWLTANNDASEYWTTHIDEWNLLNSNKHFTKRLKEKGCHPPEYESQYAWAKYSAKWGINLPLNPKFDVLPFFIEISTKEHLCEISLLGCPRGAFENDTWLSEGTSSFVKVNWAAPREYLYHCFKTMVHNKQEILKMQKKQPSNKRTQFEQFDNCLKIWDLRQQKFTYGEIAKQVYPKEKMIAASRVKSRYTEACRLIQGGYKDIG